MALLWTLLALSGAAAAAEDLSGATGGWFSSSQPLKLGLNRVARSVPRKEVDATGLHEKMLNKVLLESNGPAGAVGRMEGAAYADYSVEVTIGNQTFEVIADTGSSMFAVAAAKEAGCSHYYHGKCSGLNLNQEYGSGSWSGKACQGDPVSLAGLPAGQPTFGGIKAQQEFLTSCESNGNGIQNQGILGMGYASLLQDFEGAPLFDSVAKLNGLPNVFSMQCCSWNGGNSPGTGALVLGGVDTALFQGGISGIKWTPVTRELYFCVGLTSATAGSPGPSGTPSPQATTSSTSKGIPLTTKKADTTTNGFLATTQKVGTTRTNAPSRPSTSKKYQACEQVTGWTCHFLPCQFSFISNSRCDQGQCLCKPGSCWSGTDCVASSDDAFNSAVLELEVGPEEQDKVEVKVEEGTLSANEPTNIVELPSFSSGGVSSCSAIVDSGTSALILRQDLYESVARPILRVARSLHLDLQSDCITQRHLSSFPDVTLTLQGNVQLRIPPARYFQPMPGGGGCLAFYIFQSSGNIPMSILGQVVMEEYYTVFDKESARVGFAPIAGC